MRVVHAMLFMLAMVEVGVLILVSRQAHAAWPPVRVAGVIVMVSTVAWVALARLQLGSAFSVAPKARKLVTTGVYARIRNPIYAASPFLVLGLALVVRRWSPLLMVLVIVPVQVRRARLEAAVLHNAFGEAYDRYRAKTWF